MKKLFITSFALFTLFVSSCDFLDVRPKSEVIEDELFKTSEGCESAIYGVYGSLQQSTLYGKDMLFGVTEVLAQNLISSSTGCRELAKYNYSNTYVKGYMEGIWSYGYYTIGYANNALDKIPSDMPHYKLYRGELLGLRAFLHFDLLRLFASQQNKSAKAIPYVTKYSYSVTPYSTVSEVYTKIIADLEEAELLLADDATLLTYPRSNTSNSEFLNTRETHFNLYAVWATLARVYWQRNEAGDLVKAREYAEKVINSGKFPLVQPTEIQDFIAGTISPKETILGVYSNSFIETVKTYLFYMTSSVSYSPYTPTSGGSYPQTYEWLFSQDNDNSGADFRLSHFVAQSGSTTRCYKLADYYNIKSETNPDRVGLISGVSLLRTAEMYLIAAEGYLTSDPNKARTYFDDEIESRGLTRFEDMNKTLTIDNINIERRKELYCEGQEWFNMKRQNRNITSNYENLTISASEKVYVIPVPDDENEYRQE